MSLLIVGGTVVDLIFPRVPRLPAWPDHTEFTADNLTLLDEPPLVTLGGNGANAAYAAARLGADTRLQTNLGSDALGVLARRWLDESGCVLLEPPSVTTRPRRTAVNVTAANFRLQRATLFHPGEAPVLPPVMPGIRHLLITGWPHPAPEVLVPHLQQWGRAGTRTAIDFGPLLNEPLPWPTLQRIVGELDLFIANEHELLRLTATGKLTDALARLRSAFAGEIVIKRGAAGVAWLRAEDDAAHLRAGQPISAVNTVGAGDSFNGALFAALGRQASLEEAVAYADEAACSVVRSDQGVLGLVPPAWPPAP